HLHETPPPLVLRTPGGPRGFRIAQPLERRRSLRARRRVSERDTHPRGEPPALLTFEAEPSRRPGDAAAKLQRVERPGRRLGGIRGIARASERLQRAPSEDGTEGRHVVDREERAHVARPWRSEASLEGWVCFSNACPALATPPRNSPIATSVLRLATSATAPTNARTCSPASAGEAVPVVRDGTRAEIGRPH